MSKSFAPSLFTLLLLSILSTPLQAEITLRLLTWEGYAPDKQVKQFENQMAKKYGEPVKLDIRYVSSPNEYFNSIRKNAVDIIAPSHNIIKDERYNLVTNKLILPIDLNNIPNYAKLIPSLQHADYTTIDGQVYSVPLVHGPYGLAYNTELVDPGPTSWNVLWKEAYKQRYALSSDYFEVNVYVTALALGISPDKIADISALSAPDVQAKLNELAKNANNLWEGVDTVKSMENNALGAAWGFSFPGLASKGQNWKMAEPKEGTTSWVDGHAISKAVSNKPKHKRLAEEWINFTLSDAFQVEVIVRGIASAPVNTTIKDKLTSTEVKSLHLDDPNYFANSRILWPTLSLRERNFLKNLWLKAMKNRK